MLATTTPHAAQPALSPRPTRAGPLLVATDGRAGAGALRAAWRLAPRLGGAVTVLAVCEPLPVSLGAYGAFDVPMLPPELEAGRQATLRERVRAAAADAFSPAPDGAGLQWAVEVRAGDPALAIVDAAGAHKAPLVVVGAGRHHFIDRLLGAETALHVIRHADRPVLTVPDDADVAPRTAVVATDFSPASALAAEFALALLEDGGALHLVHAWNPAELADVAPGSLPADSAVARLVDVYAARLPGHFARLRAALTARPDVTITTAEVFGRPAEAVLAYAHAHGADLVAAGRHGRALAAHLLVGSVTAALVRGAPCAVLVTPEPSAAEAERLERAFTGASSHTDPGAWAAQLDGFTRRNAGRRAVLTVDDPVAGPRTQVVGYPLAGAAYDPHDRRLSVMLGLPNELPHRAGRHLTHTVRGVNAVTVVSERPPAERDAEDRPGRDVGLRVRHGRGQTQVAFLPDPPGADAGACEA